MSTLSPLAATLNTEPGQNTPNLAIAQLGEGGRIDLYVSNADDYPRLYRNIRPAAPDAHWIQFSLRTAASRLRYRNRSPACV